MGSDAQVPGQQNGLIWATRGRTLQGWPPGGRQASMVTWSGLRVPFMKLQPRQCFPLLMQIWYRHYLLHNSFCQTWLCNSLPCPLEYFSHFAFCRNISALFQSYHHVAQPWSQQGHYLGLGNCADAWMKGYSSAASEPCQNPLCSKGQCPEANHSDNSHQHINFML